MTNKEILNKVCLNGHIRSTILQVNLTALLLLLGVFLLVKVRFPFIVVAMLSTVCVVVIVAAIRTAYDRLMRGVLKRVDEIGIYGIGYEKHFAKEMCYELFLVLVLVVPLFFLFTLSTGEGGWKGEFVDFFNVLRWPLLFINLLQLIFWAVRYRLLTKID